MSGARSTSSRAPRAASGMRWLSSTSGRAVASAGFGLLLGGGVLFFQQPPAAGRAGEFYLQNSVPLARGTNAVNTVVIDFRGWDTLLEGPVFTLGFTW